LPAKSYPPILKDSLSPRSESDNGERQTSVREGQASAYRLYSRFLSPADAVVVSYVGLIGVLVVIFSFRISYWRELLGVHVLAIFLIVLLLRRPGVAFSPKGDEVISTNGGDASGLLWGRHLSFVVLRFWYLLLVIPFTYKELEYLIPRIHPRDYDHQLAALDYRVFGVNPVVWLGNITTPPLTLALQLSYLTYYIFPIALAIVLWSRKEFDRFHFLLFIVALGFYVSYIGYIAVPAIGPRFFLDGQVMPFRGGAVAFIRGVLNRAEGITRDCFPSGHTELTLLVLYCAYRFHRRTFWIMLAPGLALIFSTVYLRYHYAVDVVAGAIVALVIALTADSVYAALGGTGKLRSDSGS